MFDERWWAWLPLPLTEADRAAGYWWELSMRQVEVSRTEAVAALRRRGAPSIAVSPYVLAPGWLPDRIADHGRTADAVAEPLGAGDELAALVLERYASAAMRLANSGAA